jgi:cytochrome P450
MLTSNPPDHTRMRRLFSGAFTPRRINGLRDAIEAQAREFTDVMKAARSADLMSDFAYRLPVAVICELLGVPRKDREWFRSVAVDVTAALEFSMTEAQQHAYAGALELLLAYFADLTARRRRVPEDDLISEVAGSDSLTADELLRNLVLVLIAGFETTTNLIGNGLMILLERPDQLRRLRDEPELAESYVEEFLRFDAPVQLTTRIAVQRTVVSGQVIEPGSYVVVLLGSANRDEARFANADEFDPGREGDTSLSFGAGAHFCLGNALARIEARVAFPILLSELNGLELDGKPTRRERLVMRGYETLPIKWHS